MTPRIRMNSTAASWLVSSTSVSSPMASRPSRTPPEARQRWRCWRRSRPTSLGGTPRCPTSHTGPRRRWSHWDDSRRRSRRHRGGRARVARVARLDAPTRRRSRRSGRAASPPCGGPSAMPSMRVGLRRRRSTTVADAPAASARLMSTELAASTSSERSTSKSAAAESAASFAAVDAPASRRAAAFARRPSSSIGDIGLQARAQ